MEPSFEEVFADPQLCLPLQQQMLPLLGVHDLARLAVSCQSLRRLVMAADPRIWQTAARVVLPWRHDLPPVIPEVQAALQSHTTSSQHIATGRFTQVGEPSVEDFCPALVVALK